MTGAPAGHACPLPTAIVKRPGWVLDEVGVTCTPGLLRPDNAIAVAGLYLAGDYTASDYPATIESAVRSGTGERRVPAR